MSNLWYLVFWALLAFLTINCKTTSKTTQAPELSSNDTRDLPEVDNALIMKECNESFRIEMSYIESLNTSGNFPDETDRTPKCFVRCMLERNSVVSEDGVFDLEQALVFFALQRPGTAMDDFRETTEACSNRNETCMCERAYRFVKCVVEMEQNNSDKL